MRNYEGGCTLIQGMHKYLILFRLFNMSNNLKLFVLKKITIPNIHRSYVKNL